MSQKLNGGGQERASQVLGGHFQICNLGPKSASVSPKTALQPAKNGQMKGNSSYSTHAVRLPRVKRPSNSNICPRTAPKWSPKTLEFVHIGRRQPKTKNRPYLGLRGSKPEFERIKSTCNHPLVLVSTPQNCPNQRLDPRT